MDQVTARIRVLCSDLSSLPLPFGGKKLHDQRQWEEHMSSQHGAYVTCGERQVTSSYYAALVESCEMFCARGQSCSFEVYKPTTWLHAVSVRSLNI